MKKVSHLPILFFLALLLGSCSSIKVTSDYDKEVDFNNYKTLEFYGWAEESDQILNRFDRERIEEAFGNEFSSRGMTLAEDNADVVVSLFIVVDEKTSKTAYTDHYNMGGFGPGWGYGYGYGYGGGMGMGTSTTTYTESDYLVGTLIANVFDAESKKLVWQGIGTKTVDENPNSRDKNIAKAVAKIMEAYPVPASK